MVKTKNAAQNEPKTEKEDLEFIINERNILSVVYEPNYKKLKKDYNNFINFVYCYFSLAYLEFYLNHIKLKALLYCSFSLFILEIKLDYILNYSHYFDSIENKLRRNKENV